MTNNEIALQLAKIADTQKEMQWLIDSWSKRFAEISKMKHDILCYIVKIDGESILGVFQDADDANAFLGDKIPELKKKKQTANIHRLLCRANYIPE